jgi:hypothetical protein
MLNVKYGHQESEQCMVVAILAEWLKMPFLAVL